MEQFGLSRFWNRCKAVLKAYPLVGLAFLGASFALTLCRFLERDLPLQWTLPHGRDSFEPLAAILGAIGAVYTALVLIFRKADSAQEANAYGFTRGIAIGYYFNFVQPVTRAIRAADSDLHAHVDAQDVKLVESVVIGLPQSMDDCRKLHDDASQKGLEKMLGPAFEVKPIQFKGFSRPIFAKLVVNSANRRAVIVDIPTTLAVVPEFAKFVAETGGPDASADDGVVEARKEIASLESIEKFKPAIDEFQRAVYTAALPEPLRASPISMLNFVATPRLLQRIGELTR